MQFLKRTEKHGLTQLLAALKAYFLEHRRQVAAAAPEALRRLARGSPELTAELLLAQDNEALGQGPAQGQAAGVGGGAGGGGGGKGGKVGGGGAADGGMKKGKKGKEEGTGCACIVS